MSAVQIEAQARCGLMDDPLVVRVRGLQASHSVTLAALLQEKALTYTAYAHYQADPEGCVDLTRDPALGGSYEGVEPEGLLWSLAPSPDQRKGVRLMKNDVTTPYHVRVSVLEGHLVANTKEHHSQEQVLGHVDLERFYMAPWVKREEVRQGAIRGTLFYPNTEGARYPGVVDLYGTAGGLVEYRAALLASRGFATLALAYFAFEDLPADVKQLRLEYFEEAVDWLSNHPHVSPGGVGIIGISKGSEIAIQIPIYTSKVKAAVSISGAHVNCIVPNTYKDQYIPAIPVDESMIKITEEGAVYKSWLEADNVDDCIIPIDKAPHTQFLFIHGTDDKMYRPKHSVALVQRLLDAGLDNFELHIYPRAGHLLEPPYTPFCRTPWHKVYKYYIVYGGYLEPHAKAQEDMWHQVLSFFRRNLPPPEGVDVATRESSQLNQTSNSKFKSHL